VAHKVIINDWITQHCEDAEDLEGCKKIHLHTYSEVPNKRGAPITV